MPKTIQILSDEDFIQVPWKNGGGVTVELIAETCVNDGKFLWRLSKADIDVDGPFSDFTGYDRTLVLLSGGGVTLTHSSKQVDRLTTRYSMAVFPGDVETHATLHDGPVQDFNVITRRGMWSADVRVAQESGAIEVRSDTSILLAYAVEDAATIKTPEGDVVELNHGCLLKADEATPGPWHISGSSTIVVQLRELGSSLPISHFQVRRI